MVGKVGVGLILGARACPIGSNSNPAKIANIATATPIRITAHLGQLKGSIYCPPTGKLEPLRK